MLTAHVSRDVPPFAEVAPDLVVPPGLEQVILHGLQKVSSERTQSATEYMEALDHVLHAAGVEMAMAPRASGAMMTPTPPPGSLHVGMLATPTPGSLHAHMMGTPAGGTAVTPMPTSDSVPVVRRTSIADAGPLPKKYIVTAILIVLAAIGTALYVVSSNRAKTTVTSSVPVVVPIPIGGTSTVDKQTRIKAALPDLATGKTCADRKAASPVLVELGDASVVPELKRARYRCAGGVLGIGESNANACLKSEAEKASQTLTK